MCRKCKYPIYDFKCFTIIMHWLLTRRRDANKRMDGRVHLCVFNSTQNAMQPNQFSASVGTRALDEYEMSNRKKPKSFILLTWGFPFNADADAEVGYKCSSLRTNTNTLHIFQVNIPNCLARSFYWHKSKPKWSHSFGLFVAREEKRVCYHHITPNWRDRWTALNLVHQFFVLRCTFFFTVHLSFLFLINAIKRVLDNCRISFIREVEFEIRAKAR